MSHPFFENSVNHLEKQEWQDLKNTVEYFLGNPRRPDNRDIMYNLMEHFRNLGCKVSTKLPFLHSHIDYFPQNFSSISEEHGERFHQDIRGMKKAHQSGWTVNMNTLLLS
jgi:hypothetical protein